MRILTRYLLRVHVGPFLFALFALTSLLFVNVVARRFAELAGKGLSAQVIAEVFALSLPHIFALTLPMAVLVAVLYAFSQLAADNEITALKASGVNLISLMVPLVVAGIGLAAFMVYFNDRILPETNHDLKLLLMDVNRKSPNAHAGRTSYQRNSDPGHADPDFLQAAQIDRVTNKMHGVVIYDLSLGGRDRTVYADSGKMAFNREQTDLFLTLYDGSVEEVKEAEPYRFQRVFFTEQQLMLAGIGNVLERTTEDAYRSDREMSLAMLSAGVDSARKDLMAATKNARRIGVMAVEPVLGGASSDSAEGALRNAASEARMYAAQAATARQRMNELEVEWHKKFAIPFACIVFVLLGAPLAIRFPRGGPGMVIALSLTIFGIYYMSLIGGESLGDKGRVEPFVGPWAPNLIFLPFSLWALARIGRETATTRGGGWSDLAAAVKGIFTPWRRKRGR